MTINGGLPRVWMEEISDYFKTSSGNSLELIRKTTKYQSSGQPISRMRIAPVISATCSLIKLRYTYEIFKAKYIEAHSSSFSLRCHYLQCKLSGLL